MNPTAVSTAPVQPGWKRSDPVGALITREWLVTNA